MRTLILLAIITTAAHGGDFQIDSRHRLLEAGKDSTVEMGASVAGLAFVDAAGRTHRVKDYEATAFVFLSTSCPLAKRYTQRLNRLSDEFVDKKAAIFGVFSNSEDSRSDVSQHADEMQFGFPITKDDYGYLAKRLGAKMTPQVVVVDRLGTIRYRGAIDDNRYENRVSKTYLYDALSALCAGQKIETVETTSVGCSIHFPQLNDDGAITYTQHVARTLQDNCQSCHRPGQVAPFSLTNYEEARTWATEIQHYTKAGLMPPWKPASGFGVFQHERTLSAEAIHLIERWVEGGTPEGPAAAMPPQPLFADEWVLGAPDYIVEMPKEYTIGPEGEDDYRHFIIPTDFEEDRYVRASDVIPGNRQTVHHVIAYVDTSGVARKLDEADPGPGYTRFGDVGFEPVSGVGGWAPGSLPTPAPKGTGFWLPKGADIVLQVHYYRTGKEEKDRTKLGLYFAKEEHPKKVEMGIAINPRFRIPPGDKRHKVEADWEVEEDVFAISIAPHMHLIGKEMKIEARLPNGKVEPMIWIKDWDFNWQGSYRYREPILLPKGTKVHVTAYFDNSSENPNNPNNPPKPVGWGEKTTDEMCIAFVAHLKAKDWRP